VLAVVLALSSSLCWGTADFLGGLQSRIRPLVTVLLVAQVAAGSPGLVYVVGAGDPCPDLGPAALAVAAGTAGCAALAAFYRGLAIGTMSIVAPISATGAALPVIYGVLRGERATPLHAVGIGLAFVGIVLASQAHGDKHAGSGPKVVRGVGLAILAALGFGVFFIFLHEASTADVLWVGVVLRLTGVVVLSVLALALRQSVAIGWRRVPGVAVVGVLDTSANVLYAFASTTGLVSVASVLASLFPVVTVILARVVLLERLTRTQTIGVVCALAGVALIAWP